MRRLRGQGKKVKTERQFRQQLLEFKGGVVVGQNANGTTHHAATVSPLLVVFTQGSRHMFSLGCLVDLLS